MYEISLTYEQYKTNVLDNEDKDFNYQHIALTEGSEISYFLFAPEGNIVIYTCKINNITNTGAADILDYENNYASDGNKKLIEENYRSDKFKRRFKSASDDLILSCTDTDWTMFYDIDFTPKNKYFSEIVIKCFNLDLLQIRIDDNIAVEADINDFKKVIFDDDGIIMKDIDISYVKNITTLYMDLNYQRGKRLRIYQKRRTGTGDLTMKGYLLSYVERL